MDQEEKKNNRKSALITGGIQVMFLLLLYFLVAWKEPFPPIPEYGIELSFGLQESGRPTTPSNPPEQENPPPEVEQEDLTEQVPEEVTEAADQPTETEDVNSPDQQEVTESEETNHEQEELPAPTEEVVEEQIETEQVSEEQVEEEIEDPEEKQPEVTLPEETENTDNRGQANEDGQEGDPEAEIDERALYGNVTGQEGASLELSGWIWDFEPTPYDDSQETGKIVYKITIDDEGYIVESPIPIVSTVSPSVEKYYRQAVERLTFSKTSTYKTAPTSTGTITFVIKSK